MAQAPSDVQDLEGWWSEHGEVSGLTRKLISALDSGELELVAPAFRELDGAIREHLTVEEEIVFPMAEKSNPEQAQPIRSLRLAHIGIRDDLARIGEQVELSHLDAVRAMIEAFLDSFSAHERLEDQLLAVLKRARSA
ncbi:MAG: hemerythrin domain-containing protein [Myxococcota bacterium]